MAKNSENAPPNGPGTNPNVNPDPGGINPSAPTAGTEAWGTTADERRVLSAHDPADTRAGQMKGNPGDNQTAASQQASQKASTANQREKPDDDN